MKTKLFFNLSAVKVLLFFLFISICFSCLKEDDLKQNGRVNISFTNKHPDIKLSVYSIDNETIPIYEVSMDNRVDIEIPLNVGNYILKPYSSSAFYGKTGFQIMKDNTTYIEFDKNNIGIVRFSN